MGITDYFKDKKAFNSIKSFIENKNIEELLRYYRTYVYDDFRYFDEVNDMIYNLILEDKDIIKEMYYADSTRTINFITRLFKEYPDTVDYYIAKGFDFINPYIKVAVENGYLPSENVFKDNIRCFNNKECLELLLDNGFKLSDELIENYYIRSIFYDSDFFKRAIEWGFKPSLEFLNNSEQLLNDESLYDLIINNLNADSLTVNSSFFLGHYNLQLKYLEAHPECFDMVNSKNFISFLQCALELGIFDKDKFLVKNYMDSDYLKLIIKYHPDFVKYLINYSISSDGFYIDKYALNMGYLPTIEDARTTNINRSKYLMKELIRHRPEAIVLASPVNENNVNHNYISDDDFVELINYALECGYVPVEEHLKQNKRLAFSYDVLKMLINKNPECINYVTESTPNVGKLYELAISKGFNGSVSYYAYSTGTSEKINPIFSTDEYIKHTGLLPDLINYNNKVFYDLDTYKILRDKGYSNSEVIKYFDENFEVLKIIIEENPELISNIAVYETALKQTELYELGLIALNKGIEVKPEDKLFFCTEGLVNIVIDKYPHYLKYVDFYNKNFIFRTSLKSYSNDIVNSLLDKNYDFNREEIIACSFSYPLMKKYIKDDPQLILECDIQDTKEFDEVAQIAIDSGFEFHYYSTDSYHYEKSKLKGSYPLMKLYVSKCPDILFSLELTDKEHLLDLLETALENGFSISKYNNTYERNIIFKFFMNFDEEVWVKYLDEELINNLKVGKDLLVNNDEVSNTVSSEFLACEFSKYLNEQQLEIISCYPKLQRSIIELKDNKFIQILVRVLKKYEDTLDWITILEKVVSNINNKQLYDVINSVPYYYKYSEKELDDIIFTIMNGNKYNLRCMDDFNNYESFRNKYISRLIDRNTIQSLKTAYFEQVFGIDYEVADDIVRLYGSILNSVDLDSLDYEDRRILVILYNMNKIMKLNDIDLLRRYVEMTVPSFEITPSMMINYETKLKGVITRQFNKCFTKSSDDKKVVMTGDEEDLDVYLAAGKNGDEDFNLMITSIGAYTTMEEPEDYYTSWNMNKIASHGVCCSFVGPNNMGTAEVKYCCYGFTDYDEGSLQLMGPYDLCSVSDDKQFTVSAEYESQYLLPKDLLRYTRHTHNEIVWERRSIGKDSSFKKQPSYVVYFVDDFEDRLSDPEAMRQWESVKKAVNNFSANGKKLPIMVVERKKIVKNQRDNIDYLFELFNKSYDKKLISEIIINYESNYAGNRKFHLNICEEFFPKETDLNNSFAGKILNIIENLYEDNPSLAEDCLFEFEKVLYEERLKYNNTKHGVGQSLPSFNIEEALLRVDTLKSKYSLSRDSLVSVISNVDENVMQFNLEDVNRLDESIIEQQLSSSDVINLLNSTNLLSLLTRYENEVNDELINASFKVHGSRHIKNVILYTALISSSLNLSHDDILLLMDAAKYHDIGRKSDGVERHSEAGSKIAVDLLKDKYSEEDLNVLKTVIEYHELGDYEYSYFYNLCEKNNVPSHLVEKVKLLGTILKDADALDRTRFINNARLNINYLNNKEALRFVKFASCLQETYALNDLKQFNCEEEINLLLSCYTPQHILRTIRRAVKNSDDLIAVQQFINTWVSSLEDNKSVDL